VPVAVLVVGLARAAVVVRTVDLDDHAASVPDDDEVGASYPGVP
jgi:hypothetical protein